MAGDSISVEVAFGSPEKQSIVTLSIPAGSTIADAVKASKLEEAFPDYDFADLRKGVWNEVKPEQHALNAGDRVEIYRPLITDPKEARRRRAEKERLKAKSKNSAK